MIFFNIKKKIKFYKDYFYINYYLYSYILIFNNNEKNSKIKFIRNEKILFINLN
jgi:hypothetical protein